MKNLIDEFQFLSNQKTLLMMKLKSYEAEREKMLGELEKVKKEAKEKYGVDSIECLRKLRDEKELEAKKVFSEVRKSLDSLKGVI